LKRDPGWQKRRIENFNKLVSGGKDDVDLVNDSWTEIMHNLPHWAGKDDSTELEKNKKKLEKADFEKMEQIRSRIDDEVEDSDVAELLKPWYKLFCKRPCFNNDYLPAFNQENVHLIEMSSKGEERVTKTGVSVGDTEYPLDLIVYSSGFEFGGDLCQSMGVEILGNDGLTLSDKWDKQVATLHGMFTRKFPNLCIMNFIQTGYTQNNTHALGEQAQHIAYVLKQMMDRGVQKFEPSEEAEQGWVKTIMELGQQQYDYIQDCIPGYYTKEGDTEKWLESSFYGKGSPAFFDMLEKWRQTGQLNGLNMSK
jgi:cation diffusion facilitator CzcD-associated flavoprotein CzcO